MARDRLRNLIDKQVGNSDKLPYVHTTDLYSMANALEDGSIRAYPCTVFSEEMLIYLFYGRPSYRVNPQEEAGGQDHYLPICFIFKNSSIKEFKRVFPFDSGGFHEDVYADALHRKMNVEDFGLHPDPATPGKIISLFFGTSKNYLHSKCLNDLKFDIMQMEAKSYYGLVNNKLSNSGDNRVSGIEIQIEGRLNVYGNVEAIIIPSFVADSTETMALFKENSIEPVIYSFYDKMRPSEYTHPIIDACFGYYRGKGIDV
jgi:hypothetical protein